MGKFFERLRRLESMQRHVCNHSLRPHLRYSHIVRGIYFPESGILWLGTLRRNLDFYGLGHIPGICLSCWSQQILTTYLEHYWPDLTYSRTSRKAFRQHQLLRLRFNVGTWVVHEWKRQKQKEGQYSLCWAEFRIHRMAPYWAPDGLTDLPQPSLATTIDFLKFFKKAIYFPFLNYSTRRLMWRSFIK